MGRWPGDRVSRPITVSLLSRYLVDPALAAQYQQSFFAKTLELVDLPGTGIFTFDKAFAAALSAYNENNNDIEWTGYWGDEFRNFTFVGEPFSARRRQGDAAEPVWDVS
jgi:hypothetical protein